MSLCFSNRKLSDEEVELLLHGAQTALGIGMGVGGGTVAESLKCSAHTAWLTCFGA